MTPSTTAAPDDKREAILDAALTLFSERTFDGTPVPLIADTAGVAAGTIYRHFPSKEALVNALYRRWKGAMREAILEGIAGGTTTREQFGGIWQGLWRFAVEHPQAIAFLETHHHGSYLDDASRDLGTQIEAESTAFIRAAQHAKDLRASDPGVIMALVFGAFTGLVKQAGGGGLRYNERIVRQTEEIIWSALRPPGPGAANRRP